MLALLIAQMNRGFIRALIRGVRAGCANVNSANVVVMVHSSREQGRLSMAVDLFALCLRPAWQLGT